MYYLTQMLGKPVRDATGETIGQISDVAIATGEVFPRVTSLAFTGPGKTPFMLSWRKFVGSLEDDYVELNVPRPELRFSYLQPDEILLARDLLNKQIVDTQGMKIVRVNDLKLSESANQLRLLGAEVGVRGILRGISPALERVARTVARLVGRDLPENLIAWNYMDLLDRDLSHVRLSVTHKRLHELHPADVADVLEQLGPTQRARVFEHLDNAQAALTVAALEDEYQADVIDDLGSQRASDILEMMDPDDAADIIGDLPYDKAETLLRLMGVQEARTVRSLLGYREKTAGGIMTPEVTTVTDDMTVQQVIDYLRTEAAEHETIYYLYVVERDRHLVGVLSIRELVIHDPDTPIMDFIHRELLTVSPDEDQEIVAEMISKYDLLALPVVDETGKLLGIVTVDDALEVLEEESAEDLAIATGSAADSGTFVSLWSLLARRGIWVVIWFIALAVVMEVYYRVHDGNLADIFAPGLDQTTPGALFAVYAAFLLPVVLRVIEETSARSVAEIIEGADPADRPSLGHRLLRESGLGIILGVFTGIVALIALGIGRAPLLQTAAPFAVAIAVSVAVAVLVSVTLGEVAVRRSAKGRRVSGAALTTVAMVLGTVICIGLAYWAGTLTTV